LPFNKEEYLNKWLSATEERQEVVIKFLENSGFAFVNSKGSHFTFKHPSLGEVVSLLPAYAPFALKSGVLVVVCRNKKVYAPYLKRIVEACNLIDEYESVKEKEKEKKGNEKRH
jgi:predicted RNA binding protein YcfA (HicA-like mRNA interferase family)